ncbi:hypothetical protein J4573_12530 [Actinomadura barringtoniae]|uniref:Uncharacterized protein n=1 Tax=Actinomadura barringtoniae TaxID=1427535 RepID=A0A939T667_9ACTN|nr:hypothetical protein [Actinomadura barringtoniae]MBO2447922.1 hypothetical protein [Actinomadura barringtoniae]
MRDRGRGVTMSCTSTSKGEGQAGRMILHSGYLAETDSFRVIRDQLELEETVRTLCDETGQAADVYTGNVPVAHAPATNYAVGHGLHGLALDWLLPDEFAEQLVNRRGLQAGDRICLITCFAGALNGAAQQLATAIGALHVMGVEVSGPLDYIHWNLHGELLLKDYLAADQDLQNAGTKWSRVEDKAWKLYVGYLKAGCTKALQLAFAANEAGATGLVLDFAARRPDTNKKGSITALVSKANQNTGPVKVKALQGIIVQATIENRLFADGKVDRESTHQAWSTELRTLLGGLYLLADPHGGQATTNRKITKARREMREVLAADWPAHSVAYFDRLRTLTKGTAAASTWQTYISALPAPPIHQPAVQAQPQPTMTLEELDAELNQLLAEWDAF